MTSSSSDSSTNSTTKYSKKSSCDEECGNTSETAMDSTTTTTVTTATTAKPESKAGTKTTKQQAVIPAPVRRRPNKRCYPSLCVVIVLFTFGIQFFIATFLLWFASRTGQYIEWNKNVVPVQCRILGTRVIETTCSYDCRCFTDAEGHTTGCDRCARLCWDGRVYFIYDTPTVYNISTSFLPTDGVDTQQEAIDAVGGYHKDDYFTGYYNRNNVFDWKHELYSQSSIGGFIAGTVIMALITGTIYIGLFACYLRKKCIIDKHTSLY